MLFWIKQRLFILSSHVSLFRFAVVGSVNFLIDAAILNFLILLGYTASLTIFSNKFLIANLISVIISMTHSFIMNRCWVFPGSNYGVGQQALLFIVVTWLSSFVLSQLIFNHFYYNSFFFENRFLSLNFIKVAAVLLSAIINFLGYRYLVFAKNNRNSCD